MSTWSRRRRTAAGLALASVLTTVPGPAGMARAAEPSRAELEERIRRLERIIERQGLDRPAAKPAPAAAPAEPATPPLDQPTIEAIVDDKIKKQKVLAGWKDGFFLESPSGDFKMKLRGYVQVDGRFFPTEDGDTNTDSFYLRRVRPIIEGSVYKYFDYRIMPDFGLGTTSLQDAYLDIKYFPLAKLRAGKFKEPVSLERLQSGSELLFVERSIADQLAPNRSVGGQLFGEPFGGALTYQIGYFNDVVDGGSTDQNTSTSGMNGAARLFAEPFRNSDLAWAKGLGFGIAGTYGASDRGFSESGLNWRTSGRATFFKYATSSSVSVVSNGTQWRLDPQVYYYAGPFGLMGEYLSSHQDLRRVDGGSKTDRGITNTGWFVQASYVITGEDATYRTVVPINNFDPWQGRWGAFEVAARGSVVTVDDDVFEDGFADFDSATNKATQLTVGLNWYFNKNFKLQVNYEHTGFDNEIDFGKGPKDYEDVVLAQFQISY